MVKKYTDEDFIKAVEQSTSVAQVLRSLGLTMAGANYKLAKSKIKKMGIDISHFNGQSYVKGKTSNAYSLKKVMTENSTYSRYHLKNRLLKEGILENKCSECGQEGTWNGKELKMVLDHINGVNNDHRRENLRMLCPNCNSQEPTFCRNNLHKGEKNKERKKYYCINCDLEITRKSKSKLCKSCYGKKYAPKKVQDRPSKEQLLKEVEETNYCAVGRKYGVSDTCIRKWLK